MEEKKKRYGGRAKGTPNKNNPIKVYLKEHSLTYFQSSEQVNQQLADLLEIPLDGLCLLLGAQEGEMVSRFDIDCAKLPPSDRVEAEIKLLAYHTAKMQSISADVDVADNRRQTLSQRLSQLAKTT